MINGIFIKMCLYYYPKVKPEHIVWFSCDCLTLEKRGDFERLVEKWNETPNAHVFVFTYFHRVPPLGKCICAQCAGKTNRSAAH